MNYYTYFTHIYSMSVFINPLNAELNPIRHLLALVGTRHIVHVSRIGVKHPPELLELAASECRKDKERETEALLGFYAE